jgi:serine/threonine protein kinase
MAPEMIVAMEKGTYTSKVDIWSAGITAIELGVSRACKQYRTRCRNEYFGRFAWYGQAIPALLLADFPLISLVVWGMARTHAPL